MGTEILKTYGFNFLLSFLTFTFFEELKFADINNALQISNK